jgi:hypothetical protein
LYGPSCIMCKAARARTVQRKEFTATHDDMRIAQE